MNKYFRATLAFLLPLIVFYSCKNNPESTATTNSTTNTQTTNDATPLLKTSWVKRYTGTIAGEPVVVILYNWIDKSGYPISGGKYYYKDKSVIINLSRLEIDSANKSIVHALEMPMTHRGWLGEMDMLENDGDNYGPAWNITFDGPKVYGIFFNSVSNKSDDIQLTENYREGIKLDIIGISDSTKGSVKDMPFTTNFRFVSVKPTSSMPADQAEFLNASLMKLVENDSITAKNMDEFPPKFAAHYIEECKKEIKSLENETDIMGTNYYRFRTILPVFNDKDILVLAHYISGYSGGAHFGFRTNHINLDMKIKKIIRLENVLNIDTNQIAALLEKVVRKTMEIPDDKPLGTEGEYLLVDTIPPTENFIISDRGLTFCYAPYEIAPFTTGEVYLFLPYTQLDPMLKEDFKKRIGLK